MEIDVKDGGSGSIEYQKEDVMNALLVFNHVIGNYSIHRMIDKKIPEKECIKKAELVGNKLAAFVKYATGIDTKKYYKETK